MVFGTIAIVDLRLLGMASIRRPVSRITSDLMKWTWAAFALTVLTGALMFTTNAAVYYHNFYFRAKMLSIALAGINMLIFELTTGRTVHRWDKETAAPRAGKVAAALSLLLWVSVIFWGRWIGFSTSRAAAGVNDTNDVNFDNLFPGGQDSPPK
jgi:hypothetical protein